MQGLFVCAALTMALAGLGWARPAWAVDSKIVPGIDCRPAAPGGTTPYRYNNASLLNSNPSLIAPPLEVLCPISKDTVRRELRSAVVYLVDGNPLAAARCRAYASRVEAGQPVASVAGSIVSTVGASTAVQPLALPVSPELAGQRAVWFISCLLYGSQSIVGYYVDEEP